MLIIVVVSIEFMDFFVFAAAEVSVNPIFPSFQNLMLIQEGSLKQELLLLLF